MDNDFRADALIEFREISQRVVNLFSLYAKTEGLNYAAILVLEHLYRSEKVLTQKDICEKLGFPKQFVNSIIKSFWEQSYVNLKEAKDRRNKEIFLTDKGLEYAEKILIPLQEVDVKVWKCFTKEEISAFLKMMEEYEKSFNGLLKDLL